MAGVMLTRPSSKMQRSVRRSRPAAGRESHTDAAFGREAMRRQGFLPQCYSYTIKRRRQQVPSARGEFLACREACITETHGERALRVDLDAATGAAGFVPRTEYRLPSLGGRSRKHVGGEREFFQVRKRRMRRHGRVRPDGNALEASRVAAVARRVNRLRHE